jgi:putative alpha-1,2-mannosidase
LLGGPKTFISRLKYLHTSGLQDPGNEISFLTNYLYHYAGRPDLSAARTRMLVPGLFNDSTTGLPGNDDTGAMGSFTAFVMMGLFPNAGQDVYFITPPFFESISFTHPVTNATATIRSIGFDPSATSVYIQSATLNGENYTKNWIGHEFFLSGQVLELRVGMNESDWGTSQEDLPPSLAVGSASF